MGLVRRRPRPGCTAYDRRGVQVVVRAPGVTAFWAAWWTEQPYPERKAPLPPPDACGFVGGPQRSGRRSRSPIAPSVRRRDGSPTRGASVRTSRCAATTAGAYRTIVRDRPGRDREGRAGLLRAVPHDHTGPRDGGVPRQGEGGAPGPRREGRRRHGRDRAAQGTRARLPAGARKRGEAERPVRKPRKPKKAPSEQKDASEP